MAMRTRPTIPTSFRDEHVLVGPTGLHIGEEVAQGDRMKSLRPLARRSRHLAVTPRFSQMAVGIALPLAVLAGLLLTSRGESEAPEAARNRHATDSGGRPAASAWATQPLWDDGRAEVATYYATETIYGKARDHEAVLITVKEDFLADQNVKADWPYDGKKVVTMMKTNLVEDVATDNYPYRSMTSVFAPRADVMRPHKMSYSLHEWCGNTYKELRQYGGAGGQRLVYHTYWEGIASGEAPLDSALQNAMPEEQLFLAVRALPLAEGQEAVGWEAPWANLGRLRGSREVRLRVRTGVVRVTQYEAVEAPESWEIGGATGAWVIALDYDDEGPDTTFRVADNAARTLLSADFGDGRTYRLKDVVRDAYWAHE
jgi:hypothetical protein